MKQLLRTSKAKLGRNNHYHIVLVDEAAGVAVAAYVKGHTHEVQWKPEVPESQDEMGEVIPGTPGEWVVLPNTGDDGHLHDGPLEEVELRKEEEKESDQDTVNDVLNQYKAWREWESEARQLAFECEKFVDGEQWGDGQKEQLNALDRACLTINYTSKMLDELCGYERDQRQSFSYTPVEGGDQRTSDLYNEVKTQILEQCYYDREKSDVFEDTAITGRAGFNVFVNTDVDPRGEIKIERFPWADVVYAPHEKKDLSDCEGLIKHKWFTKSKFKQYWPEAEEVFESAFSQWENGTVVHEDSSRDMYEQGIRYPTMIGDDPTCDVKKKEIKVYERWLVFWERTNVAVESQSEWVENLYRWKDADVKQVETLPGFQVVERPLKRIRITRCTAAGLLSDENPADTPVDDFFLVPVYAKKRGNKFWGKIRDARDPQKEINHRHSQAVDIGNKMASYLWFIDDATFPGKKEEKDFIENSSRPGYVAKVNDATRPPTKSEGVRFPAEVVQLLQLGTETLSTILNVTVEPGGANESGKAILEKRRQRLIGNEYLFDNLSFAQIKIGRLLLPLIRKYYSPERIYRIVSSRNQNQQVMVGEQPFEAYSREEIISILENADATKYDVVVKEVEASPTVRMGTFLLLSELVQSGMPIPPEPLIELLDVPQSIKDKINESLAQQSQQQASAQETTKQMEENKTLINQGIIPPDVQARLDESAQQLQQQNFQGDMGNGQPPPEATGSMAGM